MKQIRLVDVYANAPDNIAAVLFLYELLGERDHVANISHREMPSFKQHSEFVDSRPYRAWYMIFADDQPVGATYLTEQNEIGVFILKAHQGNCYGKQAIYLLMKMHPQKRFLANIAPGNARSLAMFEKLGFELVQLTLAKEIS
jgi:RimJ/RimL family protein N-acetyltransferase